MKQKEIKLNYRLQSGDTIVAEESSLPKLANALGCNLSWFYKYKPKVKTDPWVFFYKGFEYEIINLKTKKD